MSATPHEPQGPPSVQPDVDLDSISPTVGNRLAVGLRLQEYEISGVIGEGGFGIVYLAWDHSLQRRVAIKEYMPAALARRGVGTGVEVFDEASEAAFQAGLRSFVNEAKLLARFDHPSLLKVHRFWQANGTAYMVMPLYEGTTLKQALAARGEAPDEAWLRALLAPLLDALAYLHAQSCYHRDIAPDNIMLLEDGRPLLLDFGAARRLIGDMNKAVTVILKSGYAPIEQYGETPGLTQGPWTDIYALGAVLHYALTGKVPKASVSRMLQQRQTTLTESLAGRYSESFLAAIDRMLAVQPGDRPQSIADVRVLLAPSRHGAEPGDTTPPSRTGVGRSTSIVRWAVTATVAVALAGVAWGVLRQWRAASGAPPVADPTPTPAAPVPPPLGMAPKPAGDVTIAPGSTTAPAEAATAPSTPVPVATMPTPPAPQPQRPGNDPLRSASPTVPRAIPAGPPAAPTAIATRPSAAARPHGPGGAPNARCAEIVQRVSLGEALGEADRKLLAEECRQ